MRLQPAIPLLVRNLGHPSSFFSDQSMFALAEIGGEEVVSVVCDLFPHAVRDFRRYASELLGKIHLEATVQRILGLLPGETDFTTRLNLCESLLDNLSAEGIEPARALLRKHQHQLDPELRHLRSHLITACTMMDLRFPEFDAWKAEASGHDRDQEEKMQELQEMLHEAGDDLGLLVEKMKTKLAEQRLAFASPAPRRRPLLPQGPHREQSLGFSSVAQARVGRNEPCPCGSGRKFKTCCMRT